MIGIYYDTQCSRESTDIYTVEARCDIYPETNTTIFIKDVYCPLVDNGDTTDDLIWTIVGVSCIGIAICVVCFMTCKISQNKNRFPDDDSEIDDLSQLLNK